MCNILLSSSGACTKGTKAKIKVAVQVCALIVPCQLPGEVKLAERAENWDAGAPGFAVDLVMRDASPEPRLA